MRARLTRLVALRQGQLRPPVSSAQDFSTVEHALLTRFDLDVS